jgi:hypothetical protein
MPGLLSVRNLHALKISFKVWPSPQLHACAFALYDSKNCMFCMHETSVLEGRLSFDDAGICMNLLVCYMQCMLCCCFCAEIYASCICIKCTGVCVQASVDVCLMPRCTDECILCVYVQVWVHQM